MSGILDTGIVFTLREYDSLVCLLRASAKKPNHGCFRQHTVAYRVNCFGVCEQFIALGWCDGTISVIAKDTESVVHSIKLRDDRRKPLARNKTKCIPENLEIRLKEDLVIVCSTYTENPHNLTSSGFSWSSQTMTHIYRMPTAVNGSVLFKKVVRFLICGTRHNRLLARPYVSASGNLVITGDLRGMITAHRFNQKMASYSSSTLTAVPGYVRDIQVQGSLLLITVQAFPQNRRHEEDDLIEIVCSEDVRLYILDLSTKNLIQLNLLDLLPQKNPFQKLSCLQPVWLTKGNPPMFICSISQSFPSSTQEKKSIDVSTNHTMVPVAAVFVVRNSTVSLQRVIYMDCFSTSQFFSRIPVLPSAISTVGQKYDMASLGRPKNTQSDYNRILHCLAYTEKSLRVLSDKTLLLWTTSRQTTPLASKELEAESLLALLELEVNDGSEFSGLCASARLLAYSNQLGNIQSVSALRLNPRARPTAYPSGSKSHSFQSSINSGLELWIQRAVPPQLQNDVPNLVLLSTHPLCAPRLALAPSVDLAALFSEQHLNDPRHFQTRPCYPLGSKECRSAKLVASQGLRNPPLTHKRPLVETFEQGVEVGVDCLLIDPSCSSSEHSHSEAGLSRLQDLPSTSTCMDNGITNETPVIQGQNKQSEQVCAKTGDIQKSNSDCRSATHPSLVQDTSSADVLVTLSRNPPIPYTEQITNESIEHQLSGSEKDTDNNPLSFNLSKSPSNPSLHAELDAELDAFCSSVSEQMDTTNQVGSAPASKGSFSDRYETLISEDSWWLYRCPKASSSDILRLQTKLDAKGSELVPFVTFNGTPGIAVWQADGSHPDWILAPPSFGSVYSLNVSPHGDLVWCLRPPVKQAGSLSGYAVDVFTERNGLHSLCSSWIAGQTGRWESNVLLRVTSLDFGKSFALFTTTSGTVKAQFGLSSRRPYCQSYTWPCPDHHLLQISVSETGLVWALALTKHTASADDSQLDFSMENLCILMAHIPEELQDNTQQNPSVIANRLRSACWYPILLPALLEPSLQHLLRNTTSLEQLGVSVSRVVQLGFSPQSNSFPGSSEPESTCYTSLNVGWLFVRPPIAELDTLLSVFRSNEEIDDGILYGCAFFLPNLRLYYKPDDSNWCQAPIGGFGGKRRSQKSLKLFKQSASPKYRPTLIKFPAHVVTNSPSYNLKTRPSGSFMDCSLPMWLVIQRPFSGTTILARVRESLSVYQWSKHRVHVQTIRSGSPLGDDFVHCQHVWQHPLLVEISLRESVHSSEETACCLWTVNTISNELFCHFGSSYSKSLAIPAVDSGPNAITSLCLVPDTRIGVFHLLIATSSGKLCSRIGLSASSPTGTSWVSEVRPAYWENPPSDRGVNKDLPIYFTSMACAGSELWATDNLGNLCSTVVRLTHGVSASTSISSTSPKPNIYFLSIAAGEWNSRGLGVSLWAIGLPVGEAGKYNVPLRSNLNETATYPPVSGLLYTRCWNPKSNTYFWLHVPSLNARSVHVTSRRVWMLSSTHPPQIFVRQSDGGKTPEFNLPGPTADHVGHSWQSVPLPDPLLHRTSVDCMSVWSCSRDIFSNSAIPAFDLIAISQTGELLRLNLLPSLKFSERKDHHLRDLTPPANNNLVMLTEAGDFLEN
ncbi:hypothetical protein T265_01369 [Opisthorchis viverrini]|uniref:Uncharacterized protein n=1 Tax=Opisthorchis viverrini TaxID=6198 RepID=A0A075AJ35_OPIVI|nr:hypothetical protein T265_01369 [Opisthorchis viverrini]KER32694.1 hypothetical protein T265_01369 [Opisthorchis viverrini]